MTVSVAGAALRARAAEVVDAVTGQGRSLKAALVPALTGITDSRDRALLEAMCFQALRWQRRYRFAIDHWLGRPLAGRDARVGALLTVGLAQIDALKLSPHAAVSASAEAARLLSRPALVGLVNALLRRALREGLPDSAAPGIASSHPDWLVAQLRQDWPDCWPAVLAANNRQAPLWLRVNTRHTRRDAYQDLLTGAGLEARAPAGWDDALVLDQPLSPTTLPGWSEGLVSVQDGAAQRVADALVLSPDARVLDACAAPGGKTAHLLERQPGLRLTALDRDAWRLRRISETLRRLRLPAPERLAAVDAGEPASWWNGEPYDAIVIDAPCSGTGVIRRQPDIKWHRRETDIPALAAQQARLLDALWPLLKPGGALLYATCSVLDAENEQQVAAFVARTPATRIEPLPAAFGRPGRIGSQRLPGDDDTDGFYLARVIKTG